MNQCIKCTLAFVFTMSLSANADIIVLQHESRDFVTGQIDNEHFNAPFVITAIADTDDRIRGDNSWLIRHGTASIEIIGVGTFEFLTPTSSAVSNDQEHVTLGRDDLNLALFIGPSHPDFRDWDMSTSIGPIHNDDGLLIQWERQPPIETTGGVLFFDFREDIRVTFTATVIPAPSALVFLAGAGVLSRRRKRT